MERKMVAAFIADIYRDMVRKTQYGVIQSAKRNNAKILFFTSFCDNYNHIEVKHFNDYDHGDFAIYKLPDLEKYDGLITFDSYLPDRFIEPVNKLKQEAPCPVVTLGDVRDFSYNVVNDQKRSYMELIEHLISEHNCKDMIHVAGRMEMPFSRERLQVFKDTLEKHGLPNGEDRIVYGNLWYSCGDAAVAEIMKKYEKNADKIFPDAIVCANDYMAMGVITAIEKKGFSVPEDVIVVGYDDVIQAEYNDPSVTTSAQPFEQVGKDGVNILAAIWAGRETPKTIAEPGIIKRRQSCGCEPKMTYKQDDLRESYSVTIDKLGMLSTSITNLVLSGSQAETAKDLFDRIEQSCRSDNGFSNAVLCLMEGWENQKEIYTHEDFKDVRFEVACGIYNDRPVKREKLPVGQLLPDDMLNDPEPYYIIPIHHLQYFIGYYIISPDLEDLTHDNVKSWFINISTLLENWRLKKELKISFDQLKLMYNTDVLTGLYNRRGYGMNFEEYYDSCIENQTNLAVFLIDMDNMKQINDNFGHDEGDYCLCTIANSMKAACVADEVCIRSGGDEFVVLAKDYDDEKVETYKSRLRQLITETCESDEKPFDIAVSIGCYKDIPQTGSEKSIAEISEDYLREADTLMYVEKKQHKGK